MADRDEHAVGRDLGERAGLDVLQPDVGDLGWIFATADLVDHAVPDHLDLGMLECAILQDAFGAEVVAAVNEGDLRSEVGQKQCFLDGGIAAADHDHILAAVEEAIAGGAGRDAESLEGVFRRQAEPARLRAGGKDHGLGQINLAAVAGQPERPLRHVERIHRIGDDFRADVPRLLFHLLHQPGALDHVRKAGIVFNVGRNGELAARLDALDQHRLQHGARGIDRRRITCRARADDDDLGVNGNGHRSGPHGEKPSGRGQRNAPRRAAGRRENI